MITNKSTCGLFKPHKKWKRNQTKLKSILSKSLYEDGLTRNLIKSYNKKFKFN